MTFVSMSFFSFIDTAGTPPHRSGATGGTGADHTGQRGTHHFL